MKIVRTRSSGFTLIELSIVLVIIGLVVGGVLVGRDLISAAAVRAQISQIEELRTAVNTFQLKFEALPGDIEVVKATNFNLPNAACAGTTGARDGNLAIQGGSTTSANYRKLGGENGLFWTDLASQQLIRGGYNTATCATFPTIGITQLSSYMPSAAIGRSGIVNVFYWPPGMGWAGDNFFNLMAPTSTAVGYVYGTYLFTPSEARRIDEKMDDGTPYGGKVASAFQSNTSVTYSSTDCIDSTTFTYTTAPSTNNVVSCGLLFTVR